MKSEERHQLLTNDLGVVTTKTVGFFERHLESIVASVCAVLVVGALVFWWTRSAESDNTAGWTMLDSARNLEEFGNVADRYKGKLPGQWARLKIAEKTIQNAMPLMFTNRVLALADLKTAREGFESLSQDRTAPSSVRERSLWGLALCLESTCDGDTSKPIAAFERLITEFPDTIFKTVAEERIASLKKADAKEFFEWFSKEDPKPVEARPDDFKAGGDVLPRPKFGDEDMEKEDAQNPGDAPKAPTDKTETPALPGDQPQGDAKSEEKPEAAKAAEPAKAAEGQTPPATESPKDGEKLPENK